MSINPAGNSIRVTQYAPGTATPSVTQPDQEGQKDSITLGGAARKAATFVAGTAIAALRAPIVALTTGTGAAADAALKGLGLDEKRCVTNDIIKVAVVAGTAVGAVGAFIAGSGPLGVAAAAFMAPGAIGGLVSAGKGAITGAMQGLEKTMGAGHTVQDKVEERFGEFAGKAAKIAVNIGMGAVAIPVCAVMGAFRKSIDFGYKAAGLNVKPANGAETIRNLTGSAAVTLGAFSGVVHASTIPGSILGGAAGAGAVGTGIAGGKAAIAAFKDTVKESYRTAGEFVNRMTEK